MATLAGRASRAAVAGPILRALRWRYAPRVVPVHDLERVPSSAGAGTCWRAKGNDPQFDLDVPEGGFPPGWYLFEAEIWATRGQLIRPSLYPDEGAGLQEQRCLPMKLDRKRRRVHGVVRFRSTVRRLRLDPSITPCELVLGPLRLRRLGRLEAARQLVEAITGAQDRDDRLRECLDADESELDRLLQRAEEEASARLLEELSGATEYAAWVETFDGGAAGGDFGDEPACDTAQSNPLISVLLPVYNTPARWLRRCIESVIAQRYREWELCIADDASTEPETKAVLGEFCARDSRIRLVLRAQNGHISASSNSALAMAQGSYVALLDHDDELHPLALHRVAQLVRSQPDVGLIYTDEDKIDTEGNRFDPYFKPDWNPDLFLAHNLISHFGVYRTDLVRDVDGFREGFEGSQDYDLALRCVERLESHQIRHIPTVLYHWRAVPGSTALGTAQKSYSGNASLRAIREHLERIGSDAEVANCPASGQYRVRYRLPDPAPAVSLIVPTRDRCDLLRRCVETILDRTAYPDFELIIVDNGSEQADALDYLRKISRDSRVRVLRHDAPFNFSEINNLAVGEATGSVIGLINNDIEAMHGDWLEEMVSHAARPEIGAVGAKLFYSDDTIQHAGVILGIHGVAAHPYSRKPADHPGLNNRARLIQNFSAVTAACLVVRKSVYEEVGGLDPGLAVAFNDVDFCLRVQALGYRNLWTPYARLRHHESMTRGSDETPERRARFVSEVEFMRRRWADILDNDPAYNPNLTRSGEPFTLRSLLD